MQYKDNGEAYIDLKDQNDKPDEGWKLDLRDNTYHGWSGGEGCVRYAKCVRVEDENGD